MERIIITILLLTAAVNAGWLDHDPAMINDDAGSPNAHYNSGHKRIARINGSTFALTPYGNNGESVWRSDDDGANWYRLGTPTIVGFSGSLISGPNNTLYHFVRVGDDIYMVRFNYSTTSLPPRELIYTSPASGGHGAYNMLTAAIDGNGYLYVVTHWESGNGGDSVYILRSIDKGDSWQGPYLIMEGAADATYGDISAEVDTENEVLVSFPDRDSTNGRSIVFANSSDFGETWETQIISDSDSGLVHNPHVLPVGTDDVFVFAQSGITDMEGLVFLHSADGGESWDALQRIDETCGYADPGAALGSDSQTIYVAYRSSNGTGVTSGTCGDQSRSRFVVSEDFGESWSFVDDHYEGDRTGTRNNVRYQTWWNYGGPVEWTWMQYINDEQPDEYHPIFYDINTDARILAHPGEEGCPDTYPDGMVMCYGFEDWTGDADTTPEYFSSTSYAEYWSDHESGTISLQSCEGRSAYEGDYFWRLNWYTGEVDSCLGTQPLSENSHVSIGYNGPFPSQGGSDLELATDITTDTAFIRFRFRLTGDWPNAGTSGTAKWTRLLGGDGAGDDSSAFVNIGENADLWDVWDPGNLQHTYGNTAALDDGEWHSYAVRHERLNDNDNNPNCQTTVWIDDWDATGDPVINTSVYIPDFGSQFSHLAFLVNWGGADNTPASEMGVEVDLFQIWEQMPDSSVIEQCTDGTSYGQCSATLPLYCNQGTLEDNCQLCGCSEGICLANGSCEVITGNISFSSFHVPGSVEGEFNASATVRCNGTCNNVILTLDPTETYTIADDNDDGYMDVEGEGEIYLTNGYIRIGKHWSNYTDGFRFRSVGIPQGATVNSAFLNVTSQASSSNTIDVDIKAEDADTGTALSTTLYQLDRTTASVEWNPAAGWTVDNEYESPDISSVIQEVIDRPGWASGNNLTVIIDQDLTNIQSYRNVYHLNGGSPATLTVTYNDDSKGVVPMGSGSPFYTTSQNPYSCGNLTDGQECSMEWTVVTNATTGNSYDFFTICDFDLDRELSDTANVTIGTFHDADSDQNGTIENSEIREYVGLWTGNSILMADLMEAIGLWKG